MQPEDSAEGFARAFRERYAQWSIELPPRSASDRGTIVKSRWTINYRYVVEAGEEVLYVFATHRLTNDELFRFMANGDAQLVGTSVGFYRADVPGAREEYHEANRRFYDRVKALGLFSLG